MNTMIKTLSGALFLVLASGAQADSSRDCMLEGTVQRADGQNQEAVAVKFHSAKRYDAEANCRIRRDEKLEFKLPDDPRLQDAPAGATVKYRYQRDEEGESSTELISVGTSA